MKNVFIVLDGLGYDQLIKFKPRGLMERGGRTGLVALNTLLAYSSGIYPSIWTGLYPNQTLFWTEFTYQEKQRSSVLNPLIYLPGKYFPRKLTFVISIIFEKVGLKIHNHFGIPTSIQGYFTRQIVDYKKLPPIDMPHSELISNVYFQNGKRLKYFFCDELNLTSRLDILNYLNNANTTIVCIAETDHIGHLVNPFSETYQTFLVDLDERLSQLFDQIIARWPDTGIYIFSDHGMTEVHQAFDIWTYLEKHGFRLGKEYIAFINSTLVSLWFNYGHRTEIVDLLNRCRTGRVLTREERVRYHLDFSDRRYGDEIFVVDEGVELIPNFISLAGKTNSGMHGYDPFCSSTKAFLIGGKEFSGQLNNVVDIYGILRTCGE
jgi:predicted AlkP superfamily pyrophosphatase or phosphodiesterase